MNAFEESKDCGTCPGRLVCHCLQVTEEMLLSAIDGGCATLRDIRRHTGAGSGCTACQQAVRAYIERRVSLAVLQSA
jgi:bacterioferritin-associated ferredoxin